MGTFRDTNVTVTDMPAIFTTDALSQFLPGSWTIRATNFPFWLNGDRVNGVLNYELKSVSPLVFGDLVTYNKPDGTEKRIAGMDKYTGESFVWRGNGMLKLLASHWAVTGASDDLNVLAIQYQKSLVTPAGIDIIVREGHTADEARSLVALRTDQFGLSAEQFASLTWLPTHK